MFPTTIATVLIFVLVYSGISLGRIPGFRLDRAGIALTGAALMMAVGAITPEEAYRAIFRSRFRRTSSRTRPQIFCCPCVRGATTELSTGLSAVAQGAQLWRLVQRNCQQNDGKWVIVLLLMHVWVAYGGLDESILSDLPINYGLIRPSSARDFERTARFAE